MFQSTEDFMQDYNAYKQGKHYKLMFTDREGDKIEYLRKSMLEVRLNSVRCFYSENPISVVDLKHKFEVVCKVE